MAVIKGKAKWASITSPNTRYDPVYTINLIVGHEIAKTFKEQGYFVKQEPEGPAVIIQRKVNGPKGLIRPAPKLYDKDNNEIKDPVNNGSYVAVQYNAYSGQSEHGPYQGLDLQAVKVLKSVDFQAKDQITSDGNELLDIND